MGSSRKKKNKTKHKVQTTTTSDEQLPRKLQQHLSPSEKHDDESEGVSVSPKKPASMQLVLQCLQNPCSVEVENIDYVLNGQNSIKLSELPEWYYCDDAYGFDYLSRSLEQNSEEKNDTGSDLSNPANDSKSQDVFDLKIVDTFSLANSKKNANTIKHSMNSSETEDNDILKPSKRLKQEPNFIHSNGTGERVRNLFHSSKSACADESQNETVPSKIPCGFTGSSASLSTTDEVQSIFQSSQLDDLLAIETKKLEANLDSLLERLNASSHNMPILYDTPKSQANYVKTLKTALKEKKKVSINTDNLDTDSEIAENEVESIDVARIISRNDTALSAAIAQTRPVDSILKQPNATSEFVRKKPSVQKSLSSKSSRAPTLRVLSPAKIESALKALQTDGFSTSEYLPSDEEFLTCDDFTYSTSSRDTANAIKKRLSKVPIAVSGVKKDSEVNMDPSYIATCKKAYYTKLQQSASCRRAVGPKRNIHVALNTNPDLFHLQLISQQLVETSLTALQIKTKKKFRFSRRYPLFESMKKLKQLREKLKCLGPISFNQAICKYLVYQGRKWRSEKIFQQFVHYSYNQLPVTLSKLKESPSYLKLRLAKHKLSWQEFATPSGSLIFPGCYSVPDDAIWYKTTQSFASDCSIHTPKSLTCARTRVFDRLLSKKHLPKKKTPVRSLLPSSAIASSFTMDQNLSFQNMKEGVMVVQLSHSKNKKCHMTLKIMSFCEWGGKCEEVLNTIIENHYELQNMQRGKYIRTCTDSFLIEVLRVTPSQICQKNLPKDVFKDIQQRHTQDISLVKVSSNVDPPTTEVLQPNRLINFAEAIENMLQQDKDLASSRAKDNPKTRFLMLEQNDISNKNAKSASTTCLNSPPISVCVSVRTSNDVDISPTLITSPLKPTLNLPKLSPIAYKRKRTRSKKSCRVATPSIPIRTVSQSHLKPFESVIQCVVNARRFSAAQKVLSKASTNIVYSTSTTASVVAPANDAAVDASKENLKTGYHYELGRMGCLNQKLSYVSSPHPDTTPNCRSRLVSDDVNKPVSKPSQTVVNVTTSVSIFAVPSCSSSSLGSSMKTPILLPSLVSASKTISKGATLLPSTSSTHVGCVALSPVSSTASCVSRLVCTPMVSSVLTGSVTPIPVIFPALSSNSQNANCATHFSDSTCGSYSAVTSVSDFDTTTASVNASCVATTALISSATACDVSNTDNQSFSVVAVATLPSFFSSASSKDVSPPVASLSKLTTLSTTTTSVFTSTTSTASLNPSHHYCDAEVTKSKDFNQNSEENVIDGTLPALKRQPNSNPGPTICSDTGSLPILQPRPLSASGFVAVPVNLVPSNATLEGSNNIIFGGPVRIQGVPFCPTISKNPAVLNNGAKLAGPFRLEVKSSNLCLNPSFQLLSKSIGSPSTTANSAQHVFLPKSSNVSTCANSFNENTASNLSCVMVSNASAVLVRNSTGTLSLKLAPSVSSNTVAAPVKNSTDALSSKSTCNTSSTSVTSVPRLFPMGNSNYMLSTFVPNKTVSIMNPSASISQNKVILNSQVPASLSSGVISQSASQIFLKANIPVMTIVSSPKAAASTSTLKLTGKKERGTCSTRVTKAKVLAGAKRSNDAQTTNSSTQDDTPPSKIRKTQDISTSSSSKSRTPFSEIGKSQDALTSSLSHDTLAKKQKMNHESPHALVVLSQEEATLLKKICNSYSLLSKCNSCSMSSDDVIAVVKDICRMDAPELQRINVKDRPRLLFDIFTEVVHRTFAGISRRQSTNMMIANSKASKKSKIDKDTTQENSSTDNVTGMSSAVQKSQHQESRCIDETNSKQSAIQQSPGQENGVNHQSIVLNTAQLPCYHANNCKNGKKSEPNAIQFSHHQKDNCNDSMNSEPSAAQMPTFQENDCSSIQNTKQSTAQRPCHHDNNCDDIQVTEHSQDQRSSCHANNCNGGQRSDSNAIDALYHHYRYCDNVSCDKSDVQHRPPKNNFSNSENGEESTASQHLNRDGLIDNQKAHSLNIETSNGSAASENADEHEQHGVSHGIENQCNIASKMLDEEPLIIDGEIVDAPSVEITSCESVDSSAFSDDISSNSEIDLPVSRLCDDEKLNHSDMNLVKVSRTKLQLLDQLQRNKQFRRYQSLMNTEATRKRKRASQLKINEAVSFKVSNKNICIGSSPETSNFSFCQRARQDHNFLEHLRRQTMRNCFGNLRSCLMFSQNRQLMSKVSILQQARKEIYFLRMEERNLALVSEVVMNLNRNLQIYLQKLQGVDSCDSPQSLAELKRTLQIEKDQRRVKDIERQHQTESLELMNLCEAEWKQVTLLPQTVSLPMKAVLCNSFTAASSSTAAPPLFSYVENLIKECN